MALEPGIYFGLDEEAYHADPALGSSDLRDLYRSPPDWWWHSRNNPFRPVRTETPAMAFGKAVHKLVLEGERAFARHYAAAPDPEGMLRTADDLKRYLEERGQSTKGLKAALVQRVTELYPDARVEDAIIADFKRRGIQTFGPDDMARLELCGASIAANPALAPAFQRGMPEVSVFWDHACDDGEVIRLKARFDYLKPRGIVDLKAVTFYQDMPFSQACRNMIAGRRYDVQAAHYMAARAQFPTLLVDGALIGDFDTAWLEAVAESPAFAFVWVFFQRDDAPLVWSYSLSPSNPICDVAKNQIRTAIAAYRDFKSRFGLETPWLFNEPVTELAMEELPGWYGRQ